MTKILVVDDEPQIRRFLRIALDANGFAVAEAATGQDGVRRAAIEQPDLVILDLGLPDLDGRAVIGRVREWSKVPIIVLSVRDAEAEKVAALDAGADDFVTKPFGMAELMARIRVALRREGDAGAPVIAAGPVEIDVPARRVRVSGAEVKLSKREFDLLRLLAGHAGRVVTHQQILRQLWGPAHVEDTQYLRVYVGHLRHKLGDDPARPRFIVTEPGIGYRFMAGET